MTDQKFKVVFNGQLSKDKDADQVKSDISTMFRMEAEKVEALFCGRPVILKRDLDAVTAERYRAAFEKAGAITTVVAIKNNTAEDTKSDIPPIDSSGSSRDLEAPQQTSAATSTPTRLNVAEAGRLAPPIAARGLPVAPSNMTMAEPGAVLVENTAKKVAPTIDTSHLTLADPGADLSARKQVPSPEFDVSAFEMLPLETDLDNSI
tara:strand:- start:122 stop:739 length:618 start_codon:yes stop_codon:yes gene_type:complete